MSITAPVIDYVDGFARRIYLKAGVRSYHPIDDVAIELQQLRADDETHRRYTPLVIAQGGIAKGGGEYTGRYALFINDARIVPADDADHDLDVIGEQINDGGQSGVALIDKTPLSVSVNVNYAPPPATEVVVVDSEGNVIADCHCVQEYSVRLGESQLSCIRQDSGAQRVALDEPELSTRLHSDVHVMIDEQINNVRIACA